MNDGLTRREALRGMVSAGALVVAAPKSALTQEPPLGVGAQNVELTLFSVSPRTVRVVLRAVNGGSVEPLTSDGALVREEWGEPVVRLQSLSGKWEARCGELHVRVSAPPLAVRVEGAG